MDPNPILVTCHRGSRIESVHRGAVVAVDEDGVAAAAGDTQAWIYPRSALKPVQALPLLARDLDLRLGLTPAETVCLFASHSADEDHVAAVRALLAKAGVGEAALACGPHAPLDSQAAQRLWARGDRPQPIHNNCSGKHAGFLALAKHLEQPLASYLDPQHAVQREVRDVLAELTGLPATSLVPGVDGCGAPNWPLPLARLAGLFRDLANPARLPVGYRVAAERIFARVHEAPHFLAGRRRFDTALLEAGHGRLIGKCGAEGVFALGVRARPGQPAMGIAIKIDDGAARAYEHLLPWLLADLGVVLRTDPHLETFLRGELRNTQGLVVGHLGCEWRSSPTRGD